MDIDLKPFTEKMIARVTALLGECAIELSRVIEPSFATLSETTLHAGAGEAGAVAGLGAQTLRSRIERVLAEDAPRLQRMANEAARLAAGGWGHSAFRESGPPLSVRERARDLAHDRVCNRTRRPGRSAE